MPSVNYYNRSAPFWDFIASLEEQGGSHPMFGNQGTDNNNENSNNNGWWHPWMGQGPPGFGQGPFAHRGRPGNPPQPTDNPEAPQDQEMSEKEGEAGPSEAREEPSSSTEQPHPGPWGRGREGFSGRGRCGGARGRGGWGGRGRGHHHGGPPPYGFPGMMGGFGQMANMFQEQLFGDATANKSNPEDFKPEVDVFDTPEAFVVHISLPGAKKEDVGVNWDQEKSELAIAGVVYRPGDEEFLKTLAMDERKVGAFERKVRLGSRANPASVDVDGIGARMEDGVLTVEVPKLDSGYVEVKKVDIE